MTRLHRAVAAMIVSLSCAFLPAASRAQLVGQQNFVVLRVQFLDMVGTSYSNAETEKWFSSFIPTLWGNDSAYGIAQLNFQVSSIIALRHATAYYVDESGSSSSLPAFQNLADDAVAGAPAGLNWLNLRGVVILFSDTRVGGFYRGLTYHTITLNAPQGPITLPVSVVSEDPYEGEPGNWGRIAHEVGHEMQQGGPPHPSDYHSHFEQMDGEYPAQTGVFEKEASMGFPGWLPTAKYVVISPATNPKGTETTLWAEENPPGGEPDAQAIKAFVSFGGTQLYYLISARRRLLGDDLSTFSPLTSPTDCNATATPNGIPDCGVLIERVVEGGDTNPEDADCTPSDGGCNRWVHLMGNPNNSIDHLWHAGDVYSSGTYADQGLVGSDGITIGVRQRLDPDHYVVYVSYNGPVAGPDVGLQSWLQPPSNTYETTDIWFDSPLNGYANPDTNPLNYRYGVWSDLLGGVVPIGNGDDPAVGQENRFYARIRNYGTQPATNVTVNFDVTNPPGLGIQGSNGFKNIGSVGPAQFPALAAIAPGGTADVYLDWTPNFPVTQQQIAAGQFYFHTCVRIRVNHVPGETFFANQDGNGQQENIMYFDATGAGGAPGAPGAPNQTVVRLRNPSPAVPKTFLLGVLKDGLPSSWSVKVGQGNPAVTVPPAASVDVPVVVQQHAPEPIGTVHSFRVVAASKVTFTNSQLMPPRDKHDEVRNLGGVDFHVAVLRKTRITCIKTATGSVVGRVSGLDKRDIERQGSLFAFVAMLTKAGNRYLFNPRYHSLARVGNDGSFSARAPARGSATCLFAGTKYSTSAGSQILAL